MKELLELASFIENFNLEKVGKDVVEATKLCILDSVGVTLGAKDDKMLQSIKKVYDTYDENNNGRITLWGTDDKNNLRSAVFFNSMMGHILDFDDVHTNSKTHIGIVVVPAAWALCEYLNKSGKEFMEAVICGYEAMSRIGMGFGVSSHRNRGWHVTGTAGIFGAAAACAKLFEFDSNKIMDVFGIAGTQSSSTWAFSSDGATNKILHPGKAAANGLESCMLALGGMKGSHNILDAKDGGIFPMMSDEYDYFAVSKDLGKIYEILNVDKRPYPCSRSTHCAIDAALYLKKNNHIDNKNIDKIIVKTYSVGVKQCGESEASKNPTLPSDAKFSIPYTVATAMINNNVGLDDFSSNAITGENVQDLLKKVEVLEGKKFTDRYPSNWGCEMEVTTKDGVVYSTEIVDASGSLSSPLSKEQVLNKVYSCCNQYDKIWLEDIANKIMNLENMKSMISLSYPIKS